MDEHNKIFNAIILSSSIPIEKDNLFVVWSTYVISHKKFLVNYNNTNKYFEVTYDADKYKWYVCEFDKIADNTINNEYLENL